MSRAQWTWTLLGAGGTRLDRPISPTFTSRFDAEAWLGEHRHRLEGEHVVAAQLHADDSPVGILITLTTP